MTTSQSESVQDASRLRMQAYPHGSETPPGVSSTFNSAFDLMAVADYDGTPGLLQPSDLEVLQLDPAQVLQTALEQTVNEVLVKLDVVPQELPGVGSVLMAGAEGVPYVSAGVTLIPQLAGVELPYGALVAVPRHSMILILPVASRQTLSAVDVLAGFAEFASKDAPDSCSPGLYWFVNGDAFPIGSEPDGNGQRQLVIAPGLEPVINSLPA